MLANIRIREAGQGRNLCQLDLMRFSQDQVRLRMEERGIRDDSFFVCGFEDWGVDTIMTLGQAYLLKKLIEDFYSGDEYVVSELLKRHVPVLEVVTSFYRFIGTDEVELLQAVFRHSEVSEVVAFWSKVGTFANAIVSYIEQGYVLNTDKGFYLKV